MIREWGYPAPYFFNTDMIVNTQESQIEVIGDIQEFKTGIDPKNLELITTLLSSNLYSAPERSFIREIVSNAWDSQVEAGTTDVPVLIKIGKNYVTIRDFGTGISPERFKDVYCNIGSSTKRDSNDYIGGFGIGKFSSLAVSNVVNITSYYNGKEYHYVMIKDGNNITNNLITTLDTKERNGVEITVNNLTNMRNFIDALNYIIFFPNVYVDAEYGNYFNDIKIKYYKNFAVASRTVNCRILLGNVLYPVDRTNINDPDVRKFLMEIDNTGFVIRFNIGEIDVTPNRENIIYTDKTKKIIEDRFKAAENEMDSIMAAKTRTDFTDVFKYVEFCDDTIYYDFLEGDIKYHKRCSCMYLNRSSHGLSPTYKGVDYHKFKTIDSICMIARSAGIIRLKGFITNDRIYSYDNHTPASLLKRNNYSYPKVIRLEGTERLSAAMKGYLRDNYDEYVITKDFSYDEFIAGASVYNMQASLSLINNLKDTPVLRDIYDGFMKRAVIFNPTTDAGFLKYKEEIKDTLGDPSIKNYYLYVYNTSNEKYYMDPSCVSNKKLKKRMYEKRSEYIRSFTERFDTMAELLDYIRKYRRTIVLDYVSESEPADIFCELGYTYIKASKAIVTAIWKANIKGVFTKNEVLNNNRIIRKLGYIKRYNLINDLPMFERSILPQNIVNQYNHIQFFLGRFKYCNALLNYAWTPGKYNALPANSYYEGLQKNLEHYKEVRDSLLALGIDTHTDVGEILAEYIILKNKYYRMNYDTIKRIKNNKLLNVLVYDKNNQNR